MKNRQSKGKPVPYVREHLMYPEVITWLQGFLQERFPKRIVQAINASRQPLYRLLHHRAATELLPVDQLPAEWQSWDVRVDLVGLVVNHKGLKLSIVECKNTPITLAHVSQLLGYSRVIQPEYAFLLSPYGVAPLLQKLLVTYGRRDVLYYRFAPGRQPRSVIIARWEPAAKRIDRSSIITGDDNVSF